MQMENLEKRQFWKKKEKFQSKREEFKISLCDILGAKSKYKLVNLKHTWNKIRISNWDNIMTDVEYDSGWKCYIHVNFFGNQKDFEWDSVEEARSLYDERCNKIGVKYNEYKAPDWTVWSYSFFVKEAINWDFHWCKIIRIKNQK